MRRVQPWRTNRVRVLRARSTSVEDSVVAALHNRRLKGLKFVRQCSRKWLPLTPTLSPSLKSDGERGRRRRLMSPFVLCAGALAHRFAFADRLISAADESRRLRAATTFLFPNEC